MVYDATCRFFDVEPAGRSLFSRVNVADMQSGEFNAFMLRVLTTLTELINKLHSPEVLDSMLEHLAHQHAAMPGIKQKHFDVSCSHAHLTLPGRSELIGMGATTIIIFGYVLNLGPHLRHMKTATYTHQISYYIYLLHVCYTCRKLESFIDKNRATLLKLSKVAPPYLS